MIFHISIAADEPERTAQMIAEIWRGRAFPFPPVAEGSWVAMAGDDRNTTCEVYPRGTMLRPGEGAGVIENVGAAADRNGPFHAAIATPLSVEEVKAIAARYGATADVLSRGPFHVIEFWIEGSFMFEVLPPEFQQEYLTNVTIPGWEAMLKARDARAA